jgi:hypothetical protein
MKMIGRHFAAKTPMADGSFITTGKGLGWRIVTRKVARAEHNKPKEKQYD